jgi:hypothetical protein
MKFTQRGRSESFFEEHLHKQKENDPLYVACRLCRFTNRVCGRTGFPASSPPDVTGYTSTPLATKLNSSPTAPGDPQNIIRGERLTKYGRRAMSADKPEMLISEALERNPTLVAADATLRQAHELYAASICARCHLIR